MRQGWLHPVDAKAYYEWLEEQQKLGADLVYDSRTGYAVSAITHCPQTKTLSDSLDFLAALGKMHGDS